VHILTHAAVSPWNGINALDAAVATYTNISICHLLLCTSHFPLGYYWNVPGKISLTNAGSLISGVKA
jgi:hypothetical protein